MEAALTLGCPHAGVVVHAVRGVEALSTPFRYEVDFSAESVSLAEARCASARVVLRDELGAERTIDGVVHALSVAATDADNPSGLVRHRAVVVPRPWLTSLRRGCRIFQDRSAPDVVRQVFRDAGLEDRYFRWTLGRSYPTRLYCVQYNETEWDFVNRLLEDEGITYWFEHGPDGHVMVLADATDTAPAGTPAALPFRHDRALHGDAARAWDWHARAALAVARVALRDYDPLRPALDQHVEAAAEAPIAREHYEYPGGYTDPDDGRRRARDRLDALRSGRKGATARTNALDVAVGRSFALQDHPFADGEYLVTRVALLVRVDREVARGPLVDRGAPVCELALDVVPKDRPWRPERRTPRPRIAGTQTARVTGPSGQEVYCDEHARVKVQFHWDREGRLDERASCWIRVGQAHTTGALMVPRIGWEVLVEFVEGDPDRPVVLGRLYNAHNIPPYSLPAAKTVTGHKSNSLPGSAGVNEVRFDDAAGAQRLAINGQRDINVVVANNRTAQVTRNESRGVGANRSARVGADESASVEGALNEKVGGGQTVSVGANRTVRVSGEAAEEITGDLTLSVGAMETMQVGSPSAAVLQLIRNAAVSAAQGAAAVAATRAEAALLGPMLPALNGARGALGGATRLAGGAGALLGGNPAAALRAPENATAMARTDAATAGAPPGPGGLPEPSALAGGAAAAIVDGAFSAAGVGGAGGGGGGGGGGGVGGGSGGGAWGTTVGASVTENIGALAAINSAAGVSFAVGGSSTETIGAARVELVAGSKSESTTGGKTETVGVYMVKTSQGYTVAAGAAYADNVAASLRQNIAGDHGLNAEGAAAVTVSRLKLEASERINLKCGLSEIIIDGSGIAINGLNVTIEGTASLELDASAIGPV